MPKKKDIDTNNHPYVSNYPPLQTWLDKHDARCMWQRSMQDEDSAQVRDRGYPTAYIECWMVNSRPVIIVVHANKHGWEIYTALNDIRTGTTLKDAEQRVSVCEDPSDRDQAVYLADVALQNPSVITHGEVETLAHSVKRLFGIK